MLSEARGGPDPASRAAVPNPRRVPFPDEDGVEARRGQGIGGRGRIGPGEADSKAGTMRVPDGRPRILVTAFRPFAPPGKAPRPVNRSEEVLGAFLARSPDAGDTLLLPADPRCEVALARALDRDPFGVVALGETAETGPWDTNVEENAYDLPVQAKNNGGPFRREPRWLSSAFAETIPLREGMERRDRIGSWWCNRAYFRILQWCNRFARPGVFLHVRTEGDLERQVRHLDHVVKAMDAALSGVVRATG